MNVLPFANRVIGSCESTNDLARELAEAGYPSETWVSAREQTGGRGRSGRRWEGVPGNLFFSVLVRPRSEASWTWIPIAAGVGIIEALQSVEPRASLRMKWPNDLWADGAKIGGILCEGVRAGENSFVVIGVGLNCASTPTGLDQKATSLSEHVGRRITADEVREAAVAGVIQAVRDLAEQGTALVSRKYSDLSVLKIGAGVTWAQGESREFGEVLGLGPFGELEVKTANGKKSLFAEDVRLLAQS